MSSAKQLRYYVMLALYFPLLLYSVSTFDLSEETYAVKTYKAVSVGEPTVVLGQPFQARAFLAAEELASAEQKDSTIRPQLIADGALAALGDSALVMNTDDLLAPGETERRVSYQAHFAAQQLGGNVQRFPVSGSFTVRRPAIVARTEQAQALYRNSLNRVRLSVPGLENRPLRIESSSGSVNGRTVTLSPSGNRARVRVYLERSGDDVYLGDREFAVIEPPRPQLRVYGPSGEVTSGDPLSSRRAMLRFEVEADREFKQRYPDDARYRIQRVSVYLRRGLTASQKLGDYDLQNGRLVLTQQLRDAKPGDQVTVQLESIVRINHRGQRIPVSLRESSRTFGFVVS
jgi:hypothetical protein